MTTLPDSATLDVLCPMHVLLDAEGIIRHAGPTMRKMRPELAGGEARFFDVFDIKRPRAITAGAELAAVVLSKIHLKFRSPPHTGLKGILVPIDHAPGYLVLNLSFGISIVDGVRDFALTNADFAVTDLATEMLYLVEAKTAAMEASYRLNCRLQGAKIAAEEQAFTDTLTGLKNRRALETVLRRLLAGKKSFAMMNIDLDYFKAVNDTLGHAAGDHVLQRAAQIMVSQTRRADTVARVGGDEFSIVLPNVAQQDVLHNIGARIIRELEKPISFQGTDCNISASIGTVCIHDGAAPAMEEVLADADVALYASKNAGRATQTLYSPSLREAANVVSPPRDRRQPPR